MDSKSRNSSVGSFFGSGLLIGLLGEGKFSHVFQGINSKGEIAAIKKLKVS